LGIRKGEDEKEEEKFVGTKRLEIKGTMWRSWVNGNLDLKDDE
jgi:hypothetical protein